MRNHVRCMAHVIELALDTSLNSFSANSCTQFWEAHERNQQSGENKSIDIGKSPRFRTQGNSQIDKLLAVRSDLAKIIEKIRISTYFESFKTDLHIVQNSCCINHSDTWLWKQVL